MTKSSSHGSPMTTGDLPAKKPPKLHIMPPLINININHDNHMGLSENVGYIPNEIAI